MRVSVLFGVHDARDCISGARSLDHYISWDRPAEPVSTKTGSGSRVLSARGIGQLANGENFRNRGWPGTAAVAEATGAATFETPPVVQASLWQRQTRVERRY